MANIPKVDGNFELEVNNATQSYEDTLYTDNKVISGDIHIHITAKSGVLNNTPTSGITYTEDTSQQSVLPSEGALYLNEGYYQNTKITLDHMLPDPSGTYTNPGTNDIRAGRKAYDGSGKLIVGTMADVTPSFSGGTPSLTNTTNTITTNMATASSGTYKINAVAKAKATRTKVSYNNDYTGYLDKASGTEASAAATSAEGSINAVTIYIKDASPSAEVSSLSVPSVEVSGAVTGMATVSSGSYYIQINATKTDGSVKAKYKNTQEGYAPANTGSESGASAITPSVNGSGTKIYIKSCTITNNTSGGTSSGTINRGSQIKIGQGYNASDKYYTAQANTGTTVVSSAGNTNCDGYTIVSVASGSASQPTATVTAGTISLSGVSITLQATITPSVSPGWVASGTAGVVKIKGEVPTESKTVTPSNETQTITPGDGKLLSSVIVNPQEEVFDMSKTFTVSTSNIYYIDGRCKIEISNGTYKSSTILKNTYFQLYSKSEETNTSYLTYRIPGHIAGTTSSVSFPNWASNQITTAGGSLSITLYYNKGSLFKCSTSSSYTTYTSTATTTEQKINNYLRREVLYIYNSTTAGSATTNKYSLLTYPFIKVTKVERSTSSTTYYSNATCNVYYSYSEDGTNWTSDYVSSYNSSSGGSTTNTACTIRGYYYAFTERL